MHQFKNFVEPGPSSVQTADPTPGAGSHASAGTFEVPPQQCRWFMSELSKAGISFQPNGVQASGMYAIYVSPDEVDRANKVFAKVMGLEYEAIGDSNMKEMKRALMLAAFIAVLIIAGVAPLLTGLVLIGGALALAAWNYGIAKIVSKPGFVRGIHRRIGPLGWLIPIAITAGILATMGGMLYMLSIVGW